jgi:hypothetical protein
MIEVKLFAAGLIATAMLATPAMARENRITNRQVAVQADAATAPNTPYSNGRVCIPTPRVGAFATAPWSGDNVPCEPGSY